jgi:endonuclease/exonuclease/phosphatase family metal-dependent hydrolase
MRRSSLKSARTKVSWNASGVGGVRAGELQRTLLMKLRVATLNVWAMPPPLAPHISWRMRRIGEELSRLDLDVVAFQEAWMTPARRRLVAEAREAGFEHIWTNPREPGGGGMVVASRHPIEETRFTQFALPVAATRVKDLNYFAGRGFVDVRIHTPGGPFRLVNTHLHSQSRRYRIAQLVELTGRIEHAEEPLVAVGDFNFQETSPEYQIWQGLSGFRDTAVEAGNPQPTVYPGNPMKARGTPRRIDYVFVRDGTDRTLVTQGTRRVFDGPLDRRGTPAAYSDHAGVLAELELASGRRASGWAPDREAAALARGFLTKARARAATRARTDRMIAGTGLLAAFGAMAGLRDPRISRRKLLSRALRITALASIPPAAACAVFSAVTNPDELRIYDQMVSRLDRLTGGDRV